MRFRQDFRIAVETYQLTSSRRTIAQNYTNQRSAVNSSSYLLLPLPLDRLVGIMLNAEEPETRSWTLITHLGHYPTVRSSPVDTAAGTRLPAQVYKSVRRILGPGPGVLWRILENVRR